jgi:putative SbcD/Mre11-related phosphoesterase
MTIRVIPLYPEPALLLTDEQNGLSKRYIVVSDLHLGFENSLDTRGVFIDSNLYLIETIDALLRLVRGYEPEAVIFLGDLKSSVGYVNRDEWNNVPYLLNSLLKYTEIYFIPGNHDSNIRFLLPDKVNLFSIHGMLLEDTLLLHGHTMPSSSRLTAVKRIIMGHIHPIFLRQGSVLTGQRVWLHLKVKMMALSSLSLKSLSQSNELVEIVVIPAFNRYLYALTRKQFKKSISPIVNRSLLKNAIIEAYITTLDGSLIGDISSIHDVL